MPAFISGNVLLNDSDPDDDPLSVSEVNGVSSNVGTTINGSYGSLVVFRSGAYSYSLDNLNEDVDGLDRNEILTESFSYRVSDATDSATSTLTITIAGEGEPSTTYTLDGYGNNKGDLAQGQASSIERRISNANYGPSFSPADGPNPRYVSNRIFADRGVTVVDENNVSEIALAWGQFVTHSITKTEKGTEELPIAINPQDPLESAPVAGVIPFTRSAGIGDPREYRNEVSSYLDGWAIYGRADRIDQLRDPINPAKLATRSVDGREYLPLAVDVGISDMQPGGGLPNEHLRAAGDVRANNFVGLTAIHTLFVREHNRIVDLLPTEMAADEKFAAARDIVIAELQAITYEEFLPAMGVAFPEYVGYQAIADSTMTLEWATLGRSHSQVRIDSSVQDVFFNPARVEIEGLSSLVSVMAGKHQAANDHIIDEALRSSLFGGPGVIDLSAIDVQRGRGHGMPFYNDLRVEYGLPPVASFMELTGEATETMPEGMDIDDPRITEWFDDLGNPVASDTTAYPHEVTQATTVAARLKAIYDDVNELDAFVGISASQT